MGKQGKRASKAPPATSGKACSDSVRGPALDIIAKLEEQVENLSTMAMEYLDQGLIGYHVEAIKMRDSAQKSLDETRAKLGIPKPPALPAAAPPPAAAPQAPAAAEPSVPAAEALSKLLSHPDAAVRAAAASAAGAEGTAKALLAPGSSFASLMEDVPWSSLLGDDTAGAADAASSRLPRYRWQGGADEVAQLEILGPSEAEGEAQHEADIDVGESVVRLGWRRAGEAEPFWSLTLPVAFRADASQASVVRKKRSAGGLLRLTLPSLGATQSAASSLVAGLRAPEGHGVADGFFAGNEADALRLRLAELWQQDVFQPGEVEGESQPKGTEAHAPRSDKYLYAEEDDPAVSRFARRLDVLVLQLCKEVPGLGKFNLIRGRPMAAVYSGAGSRYTPHFDAVRGDNGRVLTCILYLNPFWRKGDGAELCLWPEARTLKRVGPRTVVEPLHGRLVCFLCDDRNLHEVSPIVGGRCAEPRMAVSCWYYNSDAIPSLAAEQRTSDAPGK